MVKQFSKEEADQERENFLTGLGFRILRLTNIQVLKEIDQVVRSIQDTLEGSPSPKSDFDDFGEGAGR
jgi:very-short-patch-repair endonuclease